MFKTAYKLGDEEILATFNKEDSMTVQSEAKDCDINVIMERYSKTGQLPQVTALQPLFADFTDITDYRSALETINAARDAFLLVPAHIRAQFGNDPTAFVNYASNPDNIDQLRKWGLANDNVPRDTTSALRRTTSTETQGDNDGTRSERPQNRRPDERQGTERNGPGNPSRTRLPEGERHDRVPEV